MAFWRKQRAAVRTHLEAARLPKHLAIIMDGNGRWAKQRGLPRTAGHAAGAETFRLIATECKNLGIPFLSVYAFSTENWKRPEEEVGAIMGLLEKYLLEAAEKMAKDRIGLRFLGDLSPLSPRLRQLCDETQRISKAYRAEIEVNICLNYGGRDELLRATRKLAKECVDGKLDPDAIREEDIERSLFSAGIPDPDLVVRPSGEIRISNFLLWQSAYAEYVFTDVLWPDFGTAELRRVLLEYERRQRRFGGV